MTGFPLEKPNEIILPWEKEKKKGRGGSQKDAEGEKIRKMESIHTQ